MAYTEEVKRAIQIAQTLSKEYQNELFSPAHLLMGLLNNEVGLASWLVMTGQDVPYLREWAEVRVEASPKASRLSPNPPGDEQVKMAMELADLVAMQLGKAQTDPVCVLAALLKPGVGFSAEQLRSFPLTQTELMQAALADAEVEMAVTPDGKQNGQKQKSAGPTPAGGMSEQALLRYCIDKTAMAAEGRLDPILGRDREVRMMTETLGRRTKPNVILVGEPGVGKTALADGFALNIVAGQVPDHLQNARLLELDLGALVAGASYKGEVEDRLKSILAALKQDTKIILFIDEIHQLLDSRGPLGTGVANLLKPELAKGNLTVIGATTLDEYRKYIETDEAFSRRFDVLRVEEPDVATAIRMVQRLVPFYEEHHRLNVGVDAVAEAVTLAKRYSRNRRLPDAAIDLLDRTLSAVRMISERTPAEVAQLTEQLNSTNGAASLETLRYLHQELEHKISPILLANIAAEITPDGELETDPFESVSTLTDHIRQTLDRLNELTATPKTSVDRHDVAAVISHKTGIPLGKIQSQERDKLLAIEEVLKQRVIGQNHAVKAVADAILEARSGLTKAGQPIGSFFLLGPTGTGKTELAKSLADFLFNDESFLIRFDMSEFKEEHSAALLYGAPPGYVGYEEGGLLVNKIREKPYSVVLFDEIEKAHPSVFDIFLQILDEGRLHDRLGKEGDFSDAVVLFTSNIGSQLVIERFGEGKVPTTTELMESMSRHFRPEFLARLTEIVPFAPISEENAVHIFNLHLRGLIDQLTKQGITLALSTEARRHLALSGFTPQYGARQLKGVIRNQLRRPISRMIVGGEVQKGSVVTVDLTDDGQELTWVYEQQHAEPQVVV
ncbi:ATP-dependent Clp protease ATP-binding subunit [Spirosoma luteum]|uniref:ATP-dependent Clp protease ATP-binding subunit n=1 Tax=Spirosoma luteum TaxID=431553 RepID=UPI00037CA51E|nr:ATP-dependent Clp protease ATP-binding subunit [Spirosoma luteum]